MILILRGDKVKRRIKLRRKKRLKYIKVIFLILLVLLSFVVTYKYLNGIKIYSSNEIYHKFINYAFKDTQDQYKKLINLGESRKYLNKVNNLRSFGLFGLTRKVFGADNKNTEKKFLEYLSNIEIVLDCFNDSVETKMNFITYFLTVLTLKEIALNTFKEYIKNIEF